MTVITLTQEERWKFAAWLKQDAEASKGIMEQMVKSGTAGGKIMAPRFAKEIEAFLLVAQKLESIQDQTIEG